MMPSRGIHLVRGQTPRSIQQQCRNLSSAPRPHLRVSHRTNAILHSSRPWTRTIPTATASIPAIRQASSWFSWGKKEVDAAAPAPQAQSPPAPTPTPEPVAAASQTHAPSTPPSSSIPTSNPQNVEASTFPDLDTITFDIDNAASNISNIPEGIGYLHQIGLDYGWGPTSCLQWLLEHIHIYTGLPWWASIAATGFVLRLSMLPLFIKQSDSIARGNAMMPITKPITDEMNEARQRGDTPAVMEAMRRLGYIRKRAGISLKDQFIPPIVQGVMGYCGYKLMHGAAKLPVPSFHDGGFLWLSDLTITDGYLIMPALMAVTIHMVVRFGGESGMQQTQTMPPYMKQGFMWGMPALIAVVTAFQPGAVCVWFASTGFIGITQGQLLKLASVRKALGIAPVYYPKPNETSSMMDMVFNSGKKTPTEAPSPAAPKGPSYMKPKYQQPTINIRSKSSNTMETTLAPSNTSAPGSDMIQPGTVPAATKPSIMDNLKGTFTKKPQTSEEKRKAEKKAFKERAEEYEKRARERGRK